MRHRLGTLALAVLSSGWLLTAACTPLHTRSGAQGSGSSSGSAIVLEARELQSRNGNLLTTMIGRVAAMRVDRQGTRCPAVTFRGVKTFMAARSAAVYVDGSPMVDTCILDQLRVAEVERVELYPSGFTDRPGYRASPHGLILVFLSGGALAQ